MSNMNKEGWWKLGEWGSEGGREGGREKWRSEGRRERE